MKPFSIHDMPTEFVETFGKGAATKTLSALAGSKRLNVNLDVVPPGATSTKYHIHTAQEEFFFILSGSGVVRTPDGELPVSAGAFMAKPAGFENAHTFRNTGDAPLEILDIATVEETDVAYYPDDDVYFLRGKNGGLTFSGADRLTEWTSEPDAQGTDE